MNPTTDTSTQGGALLLRLTVLLLVSALAGCAPDDAPEADKHPARQPISFGATYRPTTRTAPGTLTLDGADTCEVSLCTVGFGVFACHTGLHPYVSSSVTPNYMWNQRMVYDYANAVWDYTPLVYWPNTIEGLYPYVSFAAYAPYAAAPGTGNTAADRCIVDMIRPEESGDPWLVYQLGGSEDDWQDHQVDLLYDFRRDQQQGQETRRVSFQLRHALASAGDMVSVVCSTELLQQLMTAYSGTPLSLILDRVSLTYTLLRKGRLWLTDDASPRWEAIASESPTVERRLVLEPQGGQVLATASSGTACHADAFSASHQGIFYIPLTLADCEQRVDISIGCHLSTDPTTTHTLNTTVGLTDVTKASSNRNIRIVLPKLSSM